MATTTRDEKSSFEVGLKKPTAICPYCNQPRRVMKNDKKVAVFETHYLTFARTKICPGSYKPVPEVE